MEIFHHRELKSLIELYYNSFFPFPLIICKIWLIIDYSSIVCLGLLVCWASIQRHILIFGPIHLKKLQSTLKFKLIPSVFALGFPLTWYSILILTCTYEQTMFQCRPCFENEKTIFLIDTLLSLLFPLLITILATFLLLIRIIRLRLIIFRSNLKKWRRCKRLTRQMILFSLDLLCRYICSLEHFIVESDDKQHIGNSPNKEQKRSVQNYQTDWFINERDEILHLFTNLIKLDLRQYWHETERLEDQQIGK